MKGSSGGSFYKALKNTFIPELVSMNYLMTAMVIVTTIGMSLVPENSNPLSVEFWFIMSMALLTGFIAAYPINWWLVSSHLKHGMMTVRPSQAGNTEPSMQEHRATGHSTHATSTVGHNTRNHKDKVSHSMIGLMVTASFIVLSIGVTIALM